MTLLPKKWYQSLAPAQKWLKYFDEKNLNNDKLKYQIAILIPNSYLVSMKKRAPKLILDNNLEDLQLILLQHFLLFGFRYFWKAIEQFQ